MKHHHMVIQILTDQSRITSSKILPTQILSAYEATNINLSKLGYFLLFNSLIFSSFFFF